MRIHRTCLARFFFVVLSLNCAFGQGYDPSYEYGAVPFQTHLQGQESVNLSSGNLHFQIPLISLPGRNGHDFVYSWSYNSQVWWGNTLVDGMGTTHYFWVQNPNWTNSTPTLGFDSNAQPPGISNGQYTCSGNYRVTLADGRKLYFPVYANCIQNLSGGGSVPAPQYNQSSGSSVDPNSARGGGCISAFAYLSLTPTSHVVLESGETIWFDANGTVRDEDTNGNTITYYQSITDTVGRQSTGVTYTDSNGVSQTVTLTNTSLTVAPHFHWSSATDPNATNQSVLTSITYPNGDRYDFQYNNYLELTKIIYPSGGYTRYDYTYFITNPVGLDVREVIGKHVCRDYNSRAHLDGNGQPGFCVSVPEDNTVITPTAAWNSPPANSATQVTSPSNDVATYAFNVTSEGAFETQRKVYSGASTMLRTIDTSYGACGIGPSQQKVTLDDGSVSMTQWDRNDPYTVYAYQTNYSATTANVTAKREYNSGTGPPVRQTATNWLHVNPVNGIDYSSTAVHILNRKASDVVSDGSNNVLAQTTYEYDNYSTAVQGSGAVQHDSAYLFNSGPLITTRGNLTATKRWLNTNSTWLSTVNTYDDAGNVLSSTDPKGNTTGFSYADSWNNTACLPSGGNAAAYVTKITNALNQFSSRKYNSCSGTTASATDLNGKQTSYSYDAMSRTTLTQYPDGGQVAHCYSDGGSGCTSSNPQLSETTTTAVTGSANMVTESLEDGIGQVVQTQLQTDPDGLTYTDTSYDGLGRVSTRSNPHRSASLPTDGTTTYSYDALNRTKSVLDPDGSTVSTNYYGTCATVTDEAGKVRKSCTDGLGRLTQVFEDPSGLNYETDYQYDALDDLLRVDQKGTAPSDSSQWRTRLFTYDSLSRLINASNPESGSISYTYDNDSNLQTKTAPQANQTGTATTTTTYCYDQLNRLNTKTYSAVSCPATSPEVRYFYDQTSYNGLTIANGIGRRTGMSDSSGATAWSYDPTGRVSTEERSIVGSSNITKLVSYTYNLDGSLATLTYPSGRVLTCTTNAAGRSVSAVETAHSINYVTAATYAPQGALASFSSGTSLFGGLSYSNRLQPRQIYYGTAAPPDLTGTTCPSQVGSLMHRVYNFNPGTDNDNVIAMTDCQHTDRTQNFDYDNLNRIKDGYTSGSGTTINNWGETYSIDAWGNLTTIALYPGKHNSEILNQAATTQNRLTGFSYDAAGNMIQNGSVTYTYDAENRIVATSGYSYVYDGDGERVIKCSGTYPTCASGTLYWRGNAPDALTELTFAGAASEEYTFFGGKRVARRDLTGQTVHYYFSDQLGSTDVIATATGTLNKTTAYYPYGGEISVNGGSFVNNYKFTGKERDAESGLDYFGARHYASPIGRWTVPDWAAKPTDVPYANFGNPQSLNLYSYVQNNPTTVGDPDGHLGVEEVASERRRGTCKPSGGCGKSIGWGC